MDRSKNKDNLRAAGKKRLEEFRQKKQQKSAATKTSGSAPKVLAEEDKLLPSASSSPRTPNHQESQFKDEGTDYSRDDSATSTLDVSHATVDSDKDSTTTDENHQILPDGNVVHSTIPVENNESSFYTETQDVSKTLTPSELLHERIIAEEASIEGRAAYTLDSTFPLDGTNSNHSRGEGASTADYPCDESSHRSFHQRTSSEGTDESEAQLLSTQEETSAMEKEEGIVLLSGNSEQKLGEGLEMRSLVAEIESLQLKLKFSQQEKEQLSVDLQSAHGELQNCTNQSAQQLSAALEAVEHAKRRESLLLADLEVAKREVVQVKGEVVPEVERLQKQLAERETEAIGLKKELVTSEDRLVELQEERSSLISEVGQFRAQLQAIGQEKLQSASELEASQRCLQSMELEKEQLVSERVSFMQQESNELVRLTEERNISLVKLLEEARLEMQRVIDENARSVSELESDLDKKKLLINKEMEEKGRLVAELQEVREQFNSTEQSLKNRQAEIDMHDEELKQLGENLTKLSSELLVSRDKLTRLQDEKSHADLEIRGLKEQMEELEGKYSACVQTLKDTEVELCNVRDHGLQHSKDLEVELQNERGVRTEFSKENDRLATKLQGVQKQLEILQEEIEMCVKKHESEMLKREEQLREIGENRTKLSSELFTSREEMTKLQEEKDRAELELQTCKEKITRLEEEMAVSSEKHRVGAAAHEESIRDLHESRILLKNQLQSCEDELGRLRVEKDEVQQELIAQMEQLKTTEAFNKDIVKELTETKQQADAHVQERAVLLTEYELEVARLQEQLSRLQGLNAVSTSDIVQLLNDLEALKREKDLAYSQVEILEEDCRRLGEEKAKLTDVLMETKNQLQVIIREEELRNSKLCTELEYYKKHAERLSEEKATLMEELEVTTEHLRGINDQKMDEIEALLKQVEELSQSKEQAVNEITAAFQRAEKAERTRMELVSKLEAVQHQLEDLSRDKDSLITDLDVSRQQYEELEKEKATLVSGFEVSLSNWKAERSDLQLVLETSKEIGSAFAAEKDRMASDLAIGKQRMEAMAEVQAHAATELGALKESIQSSDEERAQLVAQLSDRDQQVQRLMEEKRQLSSELQIHSARILVLTEEVATLTKELNSCKHRVEVSEVARRSPGARSEFLKQGREHDDDGVFESREVPKVVKDLVSQSGEEGTEIKSSERQEPVHSLEDLEGLKRKIETKEGELAHLKAQYTVLETQLESSDGERNILAQELVTLRQQLQQLSESKSHVANELAQGVEASRQRMLEYEEAKSESTSEMKKSKQDLQGLGSEDPGPWDGSHVVQGDSAELPGGGILKKRSPISRSDDSVVGIGSGVSKLIGEFERKAHAGQEQAEQLRRAVHENMRLTASVQLLESERHMLIEAPAQIADLQEQLEELGKQVSELKAEKDTAVVALLAAQAELSQSKDILKEGNSLLEDRLEVLEESVISLHTERDVLAGTLVEMEKRLNHGSYQTLRDEETVLEAAPVSDRMKDTGPPVSKDIGFLIEKLEHAVLEAFPDTTRELVSLRDSKPAVEYCDVLCDKLVTGDTGVCHQLKRAHIQLSEIRQRLTHSEEKLILVQQERDSVVQATQGYADQLAHQIADKAAVQAEVSALQSRIVELESALTLETNSRSVVDNDLRSIISKHWGEGADVEHEIQSLQQRYDARDFELSTVNRKLEEAAGTIAQQADEIKGLLLQTERLSEELEKINIERESFQSSIAQAEQKFSLTREKLSMAVNKGKAVVQQRDALKQTLAEKTMMLGELKATHEQELQMKIAALQNMESKLSELEAFKEEYIQLEARCSFLQEIVSRAEKVLQDSDHLVEGLSTVLESSLSTKDWHTWELVEKIFWITSGTSKVLQIMEASKGETESLTSASDVVSNYAEEAQARAELLTLELSSLKLEKEELVSHFEEIRSNLHQELQQKIDEKSHLTSMIRQLDSDVETLRRANEGMNRRLEEQATDLVGFEGEISGLQKKLVEREEQWHHEVLRHQHLQANVYNIARNLVDIHESLPPFEGDIHSAQSSLAWCKQFMHVLVGRYNLIVEKLDEIAGQSAESASISEEASSVSVSSKPVDHLSLRSVSTDLIKEVEEIFALVEKQAGEATTLLQRIEKQADELAVAESEKLRLQQELLNAEHRSSSIREKLSSAVTKGKALVQQRDALKQALAEKNDELVSIVASHKKELQDMDAALHETSQKLDVAMDRVDSLEKELAVVKTSVGRDVEFSSMDKVSELERVLAETQLKVSSAEAEAHRCRKAADVASSDMEQFQRTVETLASQVRCVTQERDGLVEQLERSNSQHKDETEEFLDEREKFVTTIGELENIISRQKDDMESLMRNFEELNESYNSLNAQSIEDATETTNLQDEINSLHNHIAELELAMELEAAARQKAEADSDAVVASIQEVIKDNWGNTPLGLSGDDSAGLDTSSLLEEMCNALISKYKAVVQEVEELTEQVSLLSNLEETSKAKTFSEQDSLSRMQQMLQAKDVELSELSKRMEEAASDMAQQEDVVQGLMQQVNKLRVEVAKGTGEKDTLQAELELAEQRTASTREKLSLAVKKGKSVVQQRDALKQSLAEQELLLATCKEELERKEATLARISEDMMVSDKHVQGLESAVASLRNLTSTLEHDLQERNSMIQALETVLGSYSTANEWRLKKLPQKVNWLVSAIADAETRVLSSYEEAETFKSESKQIGKKLRDSQSQAEAVKKESTQLGTQLKDSQNQVEALKRELNQLGTQLRDAQNQAECETETVSILTKKLEKTESELQWSQQRTAELEAQLPALASAHQQADTLLENVRKLEAFLDQKDEKVRNLESSLQQKDEKIQKLESILEQKQADVRSAEEAVYAWAGRSEETEAYIRGSQIRISQLESQVGTLSGVHQQREQLSNQVKTLEEVIQQKETALKTLEASRTKAVNKLSTTVSKFRELFQHSEGLVAELERVQESVESKDVEINHLKEEVGRSRALAQVLQERILSRNFLLVQLEESFRSAWPLGSDVELSRAVTTKESPNEQEPPVDGEDVFLTNVKLIQRRIEAFVLLSRSWQSELTKKDSQLQGLRKELDEANGERISLKTSLQREQTQFERFRAENASKYFPATERESLIVEEIEEVQVGKRSMPSTSAAPHVRGTRKPPSFDVAIDMDFESSRLLEVSDEKGHGFKALASARFMPRGTRFIADRIDRICVAGGRVLMRQPAARLGLTLYWLAIHIWMALLIATAHV